MTSRRTVALTAIAAALLSGCSTTFSSWVPSLPSIPPPSFDWLFGKSKKPGPLPTLSATATPRLNWQVSVGKATPGLAPAITQSAVYAAANDGTVVRVDAASGRVVWRINIGQKIAAGPGADETHVAPSIGEAPDVVGLTPGVASSVAPRGTPVCPTGAFGMPSGDVRPSGGRGEVLRGACA